MQKNFSVSTKVITLAVGLLVVLPGCWKSDKQVSSGVKQINDGSTALLTIDGKTLITERSFQKYYDDLVASNQNPQLQMMLQLLPNAKQELFKGQVNEKVLIYWADKEGVTALPEYKEKLEQGMEVLKVGLAAEFFKKEFGDSLAVTQDDARAFYELNKDRFMMAPAKDGKPAQYASFDQVKQHIEQQLQNEKIAQLFMQKITELKDTYKVVENIAPLNPVSDAQEAKAEEQVAQILAEEANDSFADATDVPNVNQTADMA